MAVSAQTVKELREKTGISMLECKKALEDANGDMAEALKILRKRGEDIYSKRMAVAKGIEGSVGSYVHFNGRVGVLVEITCQTDFVARNSDFKELLNDICLQIAATNPYSISEEGLPKEMVELEREKCTSLIQGKPPQAAEKIIEGNLKKFYSSMCLLHQPFIKDTSITIGELIKQKSAAFGEVLKISKFARFELGKEPVVCTS